MNAIPEMPITARSLAEYVAMFRLARADYTTGRILDCPGGASPFAVQVRARGGDVTAVDPAYNLAPAELSARVAFHAALVEEWMRENPGNFNWTYLGSPAAFRRAYDTAADLFLADYAPNPDRYIPAALPNLPFADGAFTLALSSHLLFTHPAKMPYDQHLGALLELTRVARQTRVYPLVDTNGAPHPRFDQLCDALYATGLDVRVEPSEAEYVRGANELLVLTRP